ncbi:ATP-dependent DNA helicase RecG [Sphingomonas lacunae]|uniref:Probable DNA 3'-5' helicase RecG n=1 Tax=Sphingomonas lacunae TaxID=2698828 RepID=A0A6M4AXC3_9SPHN|nr:ATP-dependent DNA helicase RecG [Sphingomonas lacunae]QJQ33030.1 ATP-dependent DNA helicase RecG [Sphingomonas lacunae]
MRPAILNPLFAEITARRGIGPQLAKGLARLGINRVKDALFHLPTGRIDRHRVSNVDDATVGQGVIVPLTAQAYHSGRSPRAPFRVDAFDPAGNHVAITYFGRAQGMARKALPIGEQRLVVGRLDRYGDMLQIVHPDQVQEMARAADVRERESIYPLTEGLTNARMAGIAADALSSVPDLPEWIEPGWLAQKGWPGWKGALARAHADAGDQQARDRLAYDELFAGQLALLLVRQSARQRRGRPIVGDNSLRDRLALPFALTGAQQRAIRDIDGDMAQTAPMLRLLQGDVGSGKTLVALMALLSAVEAGAQGAFLAPTEILARQHYDGLRRLLTGLPVEVALLTGRDKGKGREATLMGLADGSIHILVGTHAIFQEAVTYRNLGLVVVDEQHKFGVAQRLMLTEKGRTPPHVLAMTATPIPRTLTLAAYGEMEESRLDELPPGRTPIDTRVVSAERIAQVIEGLARHLEAGHRAYWVCPLVEESEKGDSAAAEERAAMLRLRFGDTVGLVHGRMKGPDRDVVMDEFKAGRKNLLVATTVIEVGVDVPEASLMIIESAERFGLAQLHQLRGRVGRGTAASTCLLIRADSIGETARARLALMRETNDGFRIAEEDLRLRGGGEVLGTRQSGDASFALATPEQVDRLITPARDDARLLLDRDGGLAGERGNAARVALYLFERDAGVALLRGG